MGQRWLTRPSSTMETKWKTDPRAKAPSATRNRCSRRRTNVRMACRRPSEYSPAATRSQMTLISAMGRCDALSLSYQYIAGLREGRSSASGGGCHGLFGRIPGDTVQHLQSLHDALYQLFVLGEGGAEGADG